LDILTLKCLTFIEITNTPFFKFKIAFRTLDVICNAMRIQGETKIRVRYGETDQMGFLYYGYYALYYEVARAELIRELGYPYSDMEKDGTVMPVVKVQAKYLRPARYDDLIRIQTEMEVHPKHPFVVFYHKFYNAAEDLIHKAEVTLTFFDPISQKRASMPLRLMEIIAQQNNP
jgi:acyl-CoA thioester hydrolase